jgi:hypothetical protein
VRASAGGRNGRDTGWGEGKRASRRCLTGRKLCAHKIRTLAPRTSILACTHTYAHLHDKKRRHAAAAAPKHPEDLRTAFAAFCAFGAREAAPRDMDGKALAKAVRDTGLLGGGLTATDVDLIFAKVGGRRGEVAVGGGRGAAGARRGAGLGAASAAVADRPARGKAAAGGGGGAQ